ncbi:GNAT family N-acetyltransferase [Paenibacillus sp. MBLB4367]|uniref:GNAT family N-acetyltransferase n=1 Tax=Paenibacillus sp. MBLB4367 TaxID=3384767 RepID=UPI003907FD82
MTAGHNVSRASQEEKDYVRNKLIAYNAEHVPEDLKSRYEEINLAVKDESGSVVAGCIAVLCWNWIEVDILWVDAACRQHGLGTRLLSEVETIARDNHCAFIKLNTFSFQAPDFYRKNGYEEYGVLEDAPRGSKHYSFKKNM